MLLLLMMIMMTCLSHGAGESHEETAAEGSSIEDPAAAGWITAAGDDVEWAREPVRTTPSLTEEDAAAGEQSSANGVQSSSSEESCPNDCDCFNRYETVDCSRRGLETLPLLHNDTRRLYLEDNRLVSLDTGLRDAAQLTLLIVERNYLERVDVDESLCGLTRIQELNLAANRIRSFNVGGSTRSADSPCRAPALKELNLSLNLLTVVPQNLSEFAPNLEILNLSYNEIASATLDETYAAMTSLRYLDLSRNRIHYVVNDDFGAVTGTGVPLEILSLVECGLVQIDDGALADFVNLTSLGLANNPLQQDTLTAALGRIGRRRPGNRSHCLQSAASGVDVEEYISESSCPSSDAQLVRLDISEVILTNLTLEALGGFSRLVVLDASYCELKYVDPHLFDCLPDLETLHLEGGRLERLENLPALRRLRRLHLQENRLTIAVDLHGLDALESVDLSRNRIETIPTHWLSGTRGLQIVNLSHNLITAIEPDAFNQVELLTTQ